VSLKSANTTNPFFSRRQGLGLTQQEVAHACGVTIQCWRNYESGRTVPARSKFAGLCAGLEWDMDELLEAVAWVQRELAHAA